MALTSRSVYPSLFIATFIVAFSGSVFAAQGSVKYQLLKSSKVDPVSGIAIEFDNISSAEVESGAWESRDRSVRLNMADYDYHSIEFAYGPYPLLGPNEDWNTRRAALFAKIINDPAGHDLILVQDHTAALRYTIGDESRYADQIHIHDGTSGKDYDLDQLGSLYRDIHKNR